MSKMLTTAQAAERLKVNVSRIRQYILEGSLKATKFGKSHQIAAVDVAKFKRPAMGRPRRNPAAQKPLLPH